MIQQLISHYGLFAIGGLIFFESLGLPLPGETVLLIGAAAAAQHVLPIGAVIVVAALSAVAGGMFGYGVGRRYGLALIARYGARLGVTAARLESAQAMMQRHGPKAVFLGRFVALLRVMASFLAGAGNMPYGQFLRYNALGAISWAALIGGLGFLFGGQLPLLELWLGRVGWATAGAVALAALIAVGWAGWRRRAGAAHDHLFTR
ncbi:DedA family protein [Oscillochloris sp. ZM17-4]|uniref:DedA family protein n=1 Tax=Oscillochloris sp. ZM17-4 TaxID=2866714 RepID=UPI001C732E29|nr:DedA family protein [Oscillochloris sp. ZM17-4]MBX0330719.1 DedA family protein [Oscillochloris sp. ZM17-4]